MFGVDVEDKKFKDVTKNIFSICCQVGNLITIENLAWIMCSPGHVGQYNWCILCISLRACTKQIIYTTIISAVSKRPNLAVKSNVCQVCQTF